MSRGSGVASKRKPRSFNLATYKWHALGDYVAAIRLFGGSDGFSTQLVCLAVFFHWIKLNKNSCI